MKRPLVLVTFLALTAGMEALRAETFESNFDGAELGEHFEVVAGSWAVADGVLDASGDSNKVLLLASPEFTAGPYALSADIKIADIEKNKPSVGVYLFYVPEGEAPLRAFMFRYRGGEVNEFQVTSDYDGRSKLIKVPLTGKVEPDVWYRFSIEATSGSSYRFSVAPRDQPDQVIALIEAKPPFPLQTGKVGFYAAKDSQAQFDNFSVQSR